MRQNKFPTALLLSPEGGLAADIQIALRSFGLKKLTVIKEAKELAELTERQNFALVLVDTDSLPESEKTETLEEVLNLKPKLKGLLVAIARVQSREEIVSLRENGFATVLIKPVSVGMMEQAFSELIERERTLPVDRSALRSVHELFSRGGVFEAERTLGIWLEKEPESLEALTLQALQYLKKQEFYRANATIAKALKIKADYLPALQIRTRISLRLGQLNEAVQSLAKEEKAVARLEAKRVHGPAHHLMPAEEAELSFCEDFETRAGMTALLNNLALQLSKTGHAEDALVLYRRALGPLETPESRFVTLFNRARLYLKLKRYNDASRDLQESKTLAPQELFDKIDELLALCVEEKIPSALGQLGQHSLRTGAVAHPDLLDAKPAEKRQTKYRAFNKEEVLEMVFLGKMEESTVPPESVNDWLQMKKHIMHILFLTELPLVQEAETDELSAVQQESV
jgi:tetratricopeptide (TPR) repeat protein